MSQFQQFITYKALEVKFASFNGAAMDMILENHPEMLLKIPMKQVCAQLQLPLVERFERILSLFGMSKREFIEWALTDALDRVDLILKEVDVLEFQRQESEQREIEAKASEVSA